MAQGEPENAQVPANASLADLLSGLRGAAEHTRLRLLVLLSATELMVSELTQILGQSQPRVSRHLKVMCDAGLIDRFREGTWAFYRLAENGVAAELADLLVSLAPEGDDELRRDAERLAKVRQARADAADSYFHAVAGEWHKIRSLHVPESDVEAAILELAGEGEIDEMLDIGTATGRVLEIFAPRIGRGVGIDTSHKMLRLARANLEGAGLAHCQVRHADMYNLPFAAESVDLVTVHQVLHFADEPAGVIREAARVLRPGGQLLITDFAPHDLEELRGEHAHRRLGFADDEMAGWCLAAGLDVDPVRHLTGGALTVCLWSARSPTRRGGGS